MGITAANITNPSVSFSSLIPKETCLRRPHFGQVTLPWKSSDLPRPELPIIRSVITAPAKVTPRSPATLARVWREIQGSRNWEGLVGPLDPLLQREIIRYAEFVNACYKAFDFDPNSKRHLNCKYGKRSLLREVGLEKSGYEVTKYVYVTPDITVPFPNATADPGRWVGYVAVSSDNEARRLGRRDVLLTFRGTVTPPEWIANFMSSLTPARLDPHHPRPDVKVESGFLNLYTTNESRSKFGLESCREQLLSEISRLINKYKGEEVSITVAGHSMGSALGLLFAYDVTELGLNRTLHNNHEIPITVISFGGPRVGNSGFKERCEELGVKVLRIVNANDPITKLPGMVLNDDLLRVLGVKNDFSWRCSCYAHVGVEVVLDFFTMQNPSCVHDLEFYIRLLKGVPNKEKVQSDDCAGSGATDHLDKARQWFNKNKGSLDKLSLPSWSWESAVNAILHLVYSRLSI